MDSTLCLFVNSEVLALGEVDEDFRQLVWSIIIKMDGLCETALQSRVAINEVVHLVGIAGNDTDELAAIIFQTLQQRIDSFSTKRVLITRLQGIGLVDKQHATHRRVYQLIGLDSCLAGIACHQFSTISLYQLTTRKDTQRAEYISHNTGNGSLTRSRITREDVVLTLECIGFATTNLKIEEGGKVRDFLLDSCQPDHAVQLGQTLSIVNSLRSLIRNVSHINRHHLIVSQRRNVNLLQTLSLLGNNLFENLAHRTAIGKIFASRVVQLGNHLERQLFRLLSKDILLFLGEDTHNLVELIGRVIVDV